MNRLTVPQLVSAMVSALLTAKNFVLKGHPAQNLQYKLQTPQNYTTSTSIIVPPLQQAGLGPSTLVLVLKYNKYSSLGYLYFAKYSFSKLYSTCTCT